MNMHMKAARPGAVPRHREIKAASDASAEAIKAALGERDQAILGRLGNIEKLLEEHGRKFDEREEMEARSKNPGRTSGFAEETERREHNKLFDVWLRSPRNSEAQRKLTEFEMNAKTVSIGTPAAGGYAVPEEIGRDIEKLEAKYSPVRNLVRVSRAGTSDIKRLIDLGGAEGGWRSETGAVSESNTPQLREIVPTGGEIFAYPQTTNWALEDVFFDVRAWLVESCADRFARLEGSAVISGDGTNKPTGMLNTTPVTTSDAASPKRAAAAYQYILGGDNSPASVDFDALNDMIYSLNSAYRSAASWAMSSVTAGQISKIKDLQGRPLWQPSIAVGQPATLLGYPVAIWEDLPDPNGGNFPVGFGDWNRAYELIDRSDLKITVDEVTTPGRTKFYVRRRVYGAPRNNDAVKFLKLL
jgi:HK97 family phage major capsid protein